MSIWKLCSVVVVTFVIFADFSNAKDGKRSPCPEVFRYQKDMNGIFGIVKVPIQQIRSQNKLRLEVSFAHKHPLLSNYQGYITAKYNPLDILTNVLSTTKNIEYRVTFPTRDDYFFLISVMFNGIPLCHRYKQPHMGNYSIYLLNNNIIRDDGPAPSNELPITAHPPVKSTVFNMGKRGTCSSNIYSQECSTTNSNTINMLSEKTTPTSPPSTSKIIIKPTQHTTTAEIYRPSSSTTTEQAERANPDNFVKPLKQNPNENYNSRYNSTQLDMICGVANIDSPRKWPWSTAVYQKGQIKLTVVSSGALLSDIFVITAAVPISKFNNRPTRPAELSVRVGAFDLEDWLDKSSSPRTVREIIYHPDFIQDAVVSQNNIALLRITPLKFNKFISPVCLIRSNRGNIRNMVNGMTIGWGYDTDNMMNVRSSEIAMKTIPEDECRLANPAIPYFMTPTTLCARSEAIPPLCLEEPGQGFYTKKGKTNKWILAGVLSYSLKNDPTICRIAETRLFTDLTTNVVWIEKQMYRQNY